MELRNRGLRATGTRLQSNGTRPLHWKEAKQTDQFEGAAAAETRLANRRKIVRYKKDADLIEWSTGGAIRENALSITCSSKAGQLVTDWRSDAKTKTKRVPFVYMFGGHSRGASNAKMDNSIKRMQMNEFVNAVERLAIEAGEEPIRRAPYAMGRAVPAI